MIKLVACEDERLVDVIEDNLNTNTLIIIGYENRQIGKTSALIEAALRNNLPIAFPCRAMWRGVSYRIPDGVETAIVNSANDIFKFKSKPQEGVLLEEGFKDEIIRGLYNLRIPFSGFYTVKLPNSKVFRY